MRPRWRGRSTGVDASAHDAVLDHYGATGSMEGSWPHLSLWHALFPCIETKAAMHILSTSTMSSNLPNLD